MKTQQPVVVGNAMSDPAVWMDRLSAIYESVSHATMCNLTQSVQSKQETHHEMRVPERDVTHIALFVYLLTLIHRYALNRKQSQ